MVSSKKGRNLVRSFENRDEDDIDPEESSHMNFEEKEDEDSLSKSSSTEYMNSEDEMLDDRKIQA